MRTIIIIIILLFNYMGNAQLIDPFGNIKTHEIPLEKNKDGTYSGAIEWTTGGIDSLQRFIIKGLDIHAPVLVRIISKAPNHNIDLTFHKKNWGKIESKISTAGDKFVDKVFRTMNTAGLGVRSEVAGIPYLITVKVGLQFPSTKSLIRLTDDKEEYIQHLRKLGISSTSFIENNNSNSTTNGSASDSNYLLYIIVGLLGIIALLLFIFLIKRKPSKTISILVICLGLSSWATAQGGGPRIIPLADQPDVFIGYKNQNVANQTPIPITNPIVRDASVNAAGGNVAPVQIASNPGSIELSQAEIEELNGRMQERDEQFDRDYGEGSPGQETQGDQRTLPSDQNREEIERLRRQVQRLQRQVDLLSQEDEEFEEDDYDENEVLVYCEQIEACQDCIQVGFDKFATHYVYLQYLQNFYLSEITHISDQIAHGNSIASIPGAGLGWSSVLLNQIRPAVRELERAYNQAFDEYVVSMEADLEIIRACYTGNSDAYPSSGEYEAQIRLMIERIKTTRIVQ